MVQTVNISEDELEFINQFLLSLEAVINEERQWEIETLLEGDGLEGVIQAFLSMIIANFQNTMAKFRVYPRFIKKLEDGRILIHSSTRTSPIESMDITWSLKHPKNEFQKLVLSRINTMTVPIYEETRRERTEIPRLDEKWKGFMSAVRKVDLINKVYMKVKEDSGRLKAKKLFDDKTEFLEEVDTLFGFLEGSFKFISYIAVMGANVDGWKGVFMKKSGNYEVIFDGFRELEALESLTTAKKMTEKEYIDLISYQWQQRTKSSGIKIEIEVQKDIQRIIYRIKKKPAKKKSKKKLVKGERTVKNK
ncbi:MAG: hypothetical protein KAS47_05045 [Candidatus Heimdallarchaeota archaeon]|nr:hypothetical protein [Candidatus Heimdallarchaeota archaeon]